MGEMEKPFTCPQQDCHMSFINEDHLQVHQRCHEAQLTFTSQGNLQPNSSFFKHTGFIIDQTPTPSRFWRHCEEISLFQDINLNPFDIEFHKASLNRNYRAQLSISENHGIGGGSLETPRILPPVDSDETISSTSRDDSQLAGCSSLHSSSSMATAIHHSTTANSSIRASSPPILTTSVIESNQEMEKREGRKKLTLNVSTVSSEAGQNSSIISTPTPVIMAGPSVSQTLSASNSTTATLHTPNILTATVPHITLNGVGLGLTDLNTPGLSPALRLSSSPTIDVSLDDPAAKPLESHPSPKVDKSPFSSIASPPPTPVPLPSSPLSSSTETSSVPPSPSATVLQLLLRLPNGQSIPVEIPATPVVTSMQTTRPTTAVVTTIAPVPSTYQTTAFTSVITNPTPSLAKMKLKQALASSNTAARPGATRHSRATTADRIAEMTRNRHLSGTSSNGGDAHEDNSNSSCSSSTSITSNNSKNAANSANDSRRRRNSNPDEGPEEKRRKFLERNRVAAVRCREKKKRFVESIVVKSDELGTQNQRLLNEVALLRTEVASLKSLLLRHKDCPVTLAMQGVDDAADAKFPTEVSVVAPPEGYVVTNSGNRPILPQSVTFVPIKASTSPEPPSCTGGQVAPSPQVSSSDPISKPAYVCSLPLPSTTSNLDCPVIVSSSSQICIPSFELSHCPPIGPSPYISVSSAPPKVAGAQLLPAPILQSFDHCSSSPVQPSSIYGKERISSPVIIHAPPSSTGKSAPYLPAMRGNALLIQEPKAVLPKECRAIVQTTPAVSQPASSVIIDNAFCIHSKIVIRQRP